MKRGAEKGKTDGWKVGPYFGKYLKMNLQNIKGQLFGVAAAGGVIGLLEVMMRLDIFRTFFRNDGFVLLMEMMCLVGVFSSILASIVKVDSEMLYEKPAYIYQSLPVSAFETALAKTIAGAAVIFIANVCFLPAARCDLSGVPGNLTGFLITVIGQGAVQRSMIEILLRVLSVPASAMILSGISLLGIGIGNLMRDSRDKKPKAFFSILVILLIFGGLWCIQWIFENLPGTDGTLGAAVSLTGSVIFAVVLLAANTWMMEKRYRA